MCPPASSSQAGFVIGECDIWATSHSGNRHVRPWDVKEINFWAHQVITEQDVHILANTILRQFLWKTRNILFPTRPLQNSWMGFLTGRGLQQMKILIKKKTTEGRASKPETVVASFLTSQRPLHLEQPEWASCTLWVQPHFLFAYRCSKP